MPDNLVHFVESAYKLETSPFWAWATTRRGESDYERICSGEWLAHEGLSPEALDSFCLTLRLFIQKGDGFSLRDIGEMAESWPESSRAYRDAIQRARDELELRKGERSLATIPGQAQTTKFQLFEVIFYGGIVHKNPNKRDTYREMVNAGLFSFFVFQAFIDMLFHLRNCIQTVAYNIVQHLASQSAGPASSSSAHHESNS